MGHRAVLNVMCLRRYTMELRLAGIKEAWRMRNLHFTDGRDLLTVASFSARDSEERVGNGSTRGQANRCQRPFWSAEILWSPGR
jgi:hypothetical protein